MDHAAATALARQIRVRHREPGHLRLELPPSLPLPTLAAALQRVSGVYRLRSAGRRLAIHFEPGLCTDIELAQALKAALLELPDAGFAPDPLPAQAGGSRAGQSVSFGALDQPLGSRLAGLLRGTGRVALGLLQPPGQERDQSPGQDSGQGMGQGMGQGAMPPANPAGAPCRPVAAGSAALGADLGQRLQSLVQGALTERAALNFLNDILAFYLIKMHWELITRRWLKHPLKFADAWLAVFYLVFLLVRYRKQASQP